VEPRVDGQDPAVVVSPGLAISGQGDELVICERVSLDCCGPSTAMAAMTDGRALVGVFCRRYRCLSQKSVEDLGFLPPSTRPR
jgi:hypothetical protein